MIFFFYVCVLSNLFTFNILLLFQNCSCMYEHFFEVSSFDKGKNEMVLFFDGVQG